MSEKSLRLSLNPSPALFPTGKTKCGLSSGLLVVSSVAAFELFLTNATFKAKIHESACVWLHDMVMSYMSTVSEYNLIQILVLNYG